MNKVPITNIKQYTEGSLKEKNEFIKVNTNI